jgi:hypothetical protein
MTERRADLSASPTAGPWTARHRHVKATATDDEMAGLGWEIDGPPEASLRGQFARAADAHLIAAAPCLLKVIDHPLLREALGFLEDAGSDEAWGFARQWMELRDAALAKARGES